MIHPVYQHTWNHQDLRILSWSYMNTFVLETKYKNCSFVFVRRPCNMYTFWPNKEDETLFNYLLIDMPLIAKYNVILRFMRGYNVIVQLNNYIVIIVSSFWDSASASYILLGVLIELEVMESINFIKVTLKCLHSHQERHKKRRR